ncbi:bifunctional nucleoside/nucleotide kinase/histidine phosphatase family protein [Desulfovibrio subterraneus]|uniref:bifunctional nucleoside/nucleotide kinase/histidine phosphatase family protein n=1 Tax=Desulfovibrio subterraneus TaxID=2718620 RepID=UPI0023EACE59|nr:6-phosphofructo-2-kinase/fructose-2,6-bisphosphatase [Desulfovibrio subterraneus]
MPDTAPSTDTKQHTEHDMRKLYIAMMGLPARGKTTVSSKLKEGLEQEDLNVRIFNNGALRRQILGEASSRAEFYNPENRDGLEAREELARLNMERAQQFLAEDGDVAILDATNVSALRREVVQKTLTDHPLLWVECTNDDQDLVEASILRKTRLPEFASLSESEAVASFKRRIAYYEHIYTPFSQEPCWIRVDSLRNRIIDEQISHNIPYYVNIRDILVSDWIRNLYLVRHGQTLYNMEGRIGGDSELTQQGLEQAEALGRHFRGFSIPYIFTSTRRRSHQTATPIYQGQDHCTVKALSEFDEINAGICEHMRYEEIKHKWPNEYRRRQKDKYHYIYPEGEGYITMKERVDKGLRKALYLSGNAEALMIVGHQAINRMILSYFLFRRTEDVPFIYIPQDQYFHIVSTQKKKLFEQVRFTGRRERTGTKPD